jgi:hypothetical protein
MNKSANKFREEERSCEKHEPKTRKEISRGRDKLRRNFEREELRKTGAKNQGRNFERER